MSLSSKFVSRKNFYPVKSILTRHVYQSYISLFIAEWHKSIFTNSALYGKRGFRKFLYHRRGTPLDMLWKKQNPHLQDTRGARLAGYWEDKKFVRVPEMVPELVVPDLSNFPLKPYVSYRTADIEQEKFTPEHLFYAVYSNKVKKDFEEGNLDENGNSLKPSEDEKMTAEEAWRRARSTGSDIFG